MKKINEKEFEEMATGPRGEAMKMATQFKVNDCYFISKEEWKEIGYKTSPLILFHSLCYNKRKNYKLSTEDWRFIIRTTEHGWAIKRIK